MRDGFQLTRPVWGEPAIINREIYFSGISTHSPRVGRTTLRQMLSPSAIKFQLTRPVWGEPLELNSIFVTQDISTHSPLWGEPHGFFLLVKRFKISTPSPRVGRTANPPRQVGRQGEFQLTRPVWGELG